MAMDDHRRVMASLLELPSCTLITTGRAGTDFLQSLLDSHPEILTFNGSLFFHSFWDSSLCVAAGEYEVSDLIDEFIGKHIYKLKSRYDLFENKHRLGDDFNQSLDIDLDRFKRETLAFLDGQPLTSRTVLTAIYGAYATCLGQDLEKKKLFFHHVHHFDALPSYLRDFPDSKIICMTRDPRANFVSSVEHHRNDDRTYGRGGIDQDQGATLLFYIARILYDSLPLRKYPNPYVVVRIEDLGDEAVLEALRGWLGISDDECLRRSTWGGLRWHGDRLSAKTSQAVGWSRTILENEWERRLAATDKYVLNYIMLPRLKHYGYTHRDVGVLDAFAVPLLILLPLSYERRFLSFSYLREAIQRRELRKLGRNLLAYVRRVFLFLKFYYRVTKRVGFSEPLLTSESRVAGQPLGSE